MTSDMYAISALTNMSSLVNQHISGVSAFNAAYALVVSYEDYIPNNVVNIT